MNQEIAAKKQYLLYWMYDFIEDDDEPAYLSQDVAEFDRIISSFIKEVAESSERSNFTWVSSTVKNLVEELNELNSKHGHQLIETDQREDICALISLVIQDAGHDYPADMTEEWREW
jgi:hypothetical protein